MASRPRITQYSTIVDGDLSQSSITSAVSIIQDITLASYSFSWSGSSPVGTIAIQVSNDYELNPDGSHRGSTGTWNALTLNYQGTAVDSIPVSGNSGTGFIDMSDLSAYAIRAVYTKTSGTGTLQSVFNAKVA